MVNWTANLTNIAGGRLRDLANLGGTQLNERLEPNPNHNPIGHKSLVIFQLKSADCTLEVAAISYSRADMSKKNLLFQFRKK
jgi:hypothetical protein